jgi:hypothetical protein
MIVVVSHHIFQFVPLREVIQIIKTDSVLRVVVILSTLVVEGFHV